MGEQLWQLHTIRLPPLFEEDGSASHRITIQVPLCEPQAFEHLALVTDASKFFVSREGGIGFELPTCRYWILPEGWAETFQLLGFTGDYEGLRALAVLHAVQLRQSHTRKKRGQRGPSTTNYDAREFLLADALARIADGASMRVAVCETLTAHEDISPWSFSTAENTLFMLVKRYLRSMSSRIDV